MNVEQDVFKVLEPRDYLAGHIVVGVVAIIQTVVPTCLWYLWKKPMISDSSVNPWFSIGWEAIWIGAIATHGLQAIIFPFTFIKNRILSLFYAALWAFMGLAFSAILFFLVNGFLFAAADKFQRHHDMKIGIEEIWYTIAGYIAFEFAMGVLVKIFLFDSILYMIPDQVKGWCENHRVFCEEHYVLNTARVRSVESRKEEDIVEIDEFKASLLTY